MSLDKQRRMWQDIVERYRDQQEHAENIALEVAVAQAPKHMQDENFERGKLFYILDNLLDKVDAHIEYTKENNPDYDQIAVDRLQSLTTRILHNM